MSQSQGRFKQRFSLNPVHWQIGSKIIGIVLIVVLISVSALTAFSYLSFSTSTINKSGGELVWYGRSALQQAVAGVAASANTLKTLALAPSLVEAVEVANQAYQGRDQAELEAEIARWDQAWLDQDPSADQLVQQILKNEVSDLLRRFMEQFPAEAEVFVTDIQGLNVAMTERTSDYWQADEGWWQRAYNDGQGAVSVSQVEYDESAQSWAINIGVPVHDDDGRVIGVLRGTVDISVVFGTLSQITFGETGHAALLDREGRILYAHDKSLLMQTAPAEIQAIIKTQQAGWSRDLHDLNGHPAIIAYDFGEGELAEALGWTILLDQDLEEVNAPVRRNLGTSLLVTVAVALVSAGIGLFFANTIASPILMVATNAQRLSIGDAELNDQDWQALTRLNTRRDELGVTGRAFAALIAHFKEMTTAAQRIAAGDLATDVSPRGETDLLGNAFAEMIADLRHLIHQVNDNASAVSAASDQLTDTANQTARATGHVAATIQQVAQATGRQTESVTQATLTVKQVVQAIDGVARGAQEQAVAVGQSAEITGHLRCCPTGRRQRPDQRPGRIPGRPGRPRGCRDRQQNHPGYGSHQGKSQSVGSSGPGDGTALRTDRSDRQNH